MSVLRTRFSCVVTAVTLLVGVLLAPSQALAQRGPAVGDSSIAAVPGWYQFRPMHASGMCMAVWNNEMVNGRTVHLWQCQESNSAMEWGFVDLGGGYYAIVNAKSRSGQLMCLDVPSQVPPPPGTQLQLWQCNWGSQQQWRFELSTVSPYFIAVNGLTGWLLDAAAAGVANGTPVVVYPHSSVPHQSWRVVDNS